MVVGVVGDELKIRLAAPADKGKANTELLRFLASEFGIHRDHVSLIRGDRNRSKVVSINGDVDPTGLWSDS